MITKTKQLIAAATFLALSGPAVACDLEAGGYGRFMAFSAVAHQQASVDTAAFDKIVSPSRANRQPSSSQDVTDATPSTPAASQDSNATDNAVTGESTRPQWQTH